MCVLDNIIKMKLQLVILFTACIFVNSQDFNNNMSNMPKYDERYDYLDVDAVFTNKRLVRAYVDCLLNSNRCTPEGKALKRLLPEALRTKCIRCTERQKRTAVKIIRRLKYEYPDEWAKLAGKWDPTGDFTRYFEEFLAKEAFNSIPGSGSIIPLSSGPASTPPPPRGVVIPVASMGPAPPMPSPVVPTPEPTPMAVQPVQPMQPMQPVQPIQPVQPVQPTVMMVPTTPKPIILNRFGGDGELMMGSPSGSAVTPRPTTPPPVMKTTNTMKPTMPTTKPTPMMWTAGASNAIPTRFPLRPSTEIPPPYSTAITIIDQIGYKIIRTTEIVTDLLRNTVRAVVG